MKEEFRLTQYAHGAGCGCKIAPGVLGEMLKDNLVAPDHERLLVGNHSRDDAAVYDLGDGSALISTTDFFTPVVDDPFDFGRIAAANAISDVYAMGGRPVMAIAILGWPVEKIPAEIASKVMAGGRATCAEAGIALAGGHSIDSPEPFFGLAVNGLVAIEHLKRNNTAKEGDLLFLTKPLGVGILSTAQKRGVLKDEHQAGMINNMSALNKIGEQLGKIKSVSAMTDITGFGLLGHLIEMAEGSGFGAELYYNAIPVLNGVREYIAQRISPDATFRNWNSYSNKVKFEKGLNVAEAFTLLPDPQTNGGLLIAVAENETNEIISLIGDIKPIGRIITAQEKIIQVKN